MKRGSPLHCNTCIFIRKSYLCRLCSLVTESCVSLLPKSVHYCYQNLSTPDYRNLCTSRYRLHRDFPEMFRRGSFNALVQTFLSDKAFAEDCGEIIGIDAGGSIWSTCSWSKIDVSRCPSLRYFRNNRAEALDVSCNPLLKELDCQNGTFGTLDLSANPELKKLTCNWCKDLTELNLSRNLALRELNICFSAIKRLGLHNRSVLQSVVMEDVELDERSEKYLLQILERNGGEVRKKLYDF